MHVVFEFVQAEEQEAVRRIESQRDAEDAQAEQYNHLTSDMLTENPETAVSALGSPHVVAMAYRGMTEEQRAAIRQEQLRQAQAKKVTCCTYPSRQRLSVRYMLLLGLCSSRRSPRDAGRRSGTPYP